MQNFKFPSFLIKLLISVGLIIFFLSHVDFFSLFSALGKTKTGYLLIGLVLYPVGQIICAIKWQYLARALGINRDLKPMVGLYFMGMFFNMFLPTSIGGDITRSLYLSPSSRRSSFLSVLAERATGVISMMLLASAVMLSSYGQPLPKIIRFGFPGLTLAILLGIWILPFVLRRTHTKMRELVCEDLSVFWKDPRIGVVAIFYSAIFHTILVAIHVCIARSLSIRIPIPYHFVTMSLASLASLLPSFNGIGVRDGAYIYLLSLIGIDRAHSLLFAFLWFIIMALSSSIGAIVYLIRGLSPTPTAETAD